MVVTSSTAGKTDVSKIQGVKLLAGGTTVQILRHGFVFCCWV